MVRPIAVATVVSGTLDIVFAMILTVFFGREIGSMLRYVGSGLVPQATEMGTGGAILGLLVHFALMAIMATAYLLAARRMRVLVERPIQWGILYGLATYAVMNLLVVPMRIGTPMPPSLRSVATQLFAHIVLVGIPIALITARSLKPRPA